VLNSPFPSWPSISVEEADAVSQVLLSNKVNYWTGQECRNFEKEFAASVDTQFSVAVANGTLALELAMKALKIGFGDEVIVTPRTFFATVTCVVAAGATPVFVDIDRDNQNITLGTIKTALTPRTRAIVCVHLAGWPCDMDSIMVFAEEHNLVVIEDCAQAHGAQYKGRSVGSFAHIGAWSFCQDKIMTTGGEGGMVTTNDPEMWSRMWSYKDHGKSWEAVYGRVHPPGFRWVHESFGSNFRMTEMQAAIGRIQLKKLENWSERRRENAAVLTQRFKDISSLRVTMPPDGVRHAYYKYYAFVRPEALRAGWSRDRIVCEINESGIPCYTGSCSEIYLEKAFHGTGWRPKVRLPIAKELGDTSLMFLVHPTLGDEEMHKVGDIVESVMALASK